MPIQVKSVVMKRLAIGLVLATLAPASALAVESGTGAYLLGTRGLAAGFVPRPGVYISDSIIYLQSRTKQDISIGGAIVADPSIEALVNLATVTLVPDMPAFGGTAALSVLVPYAGVDMDFSGRFLGGPQSATLHDSEDGFGDIVVTPTIGWHDGYWNYSASLSFFLPTGEYSTAEVKPRQGMFDVLSIGKNKFAVDPTVAVTWLNPNIGLEINGAAGITFSAINERHRLPDRAGAPRRGGDRPALQERPADRRRRLCLSPARQRQRLGRRGLPGGGRRQEPAGDRLRRRPGARLPGEARRRRPEPPGQVLPRVRGQAPARERCLLADRGAGLLKPERAGGEAVPASPTRMESVMKFLTPAAVAVALFAAPAFAQDAPVPSDGSVLPVPAGADGGCRGAAAPGLDHDLAARSRNACRRARPTS